MKIMLLFVVFTTSFLTFNNDIYNILFYDETSVIVVQSYSTIPFIICKTTMSKHHFNAQNYHFKYHLFKIKTKMNCVLIMF